SIDFLLSPCLRPQFPGARTARTRGVGSNWFFLRADGDPRWILLPALIAASAGLGEVARASRSIALCAALHSLGNVVMLYPVIARSLTTVQKLIVAAICLAVWIPVIKRIERETTD
ncbi:MAG: hypothetical protein AAF533_25765, partial [Acidobacteriota bacterium]